MTDRQALPTYRRCDPCDRLCSSSWDYCPDCGEPLADTEGNDD